MDGRKGWSLVEFVLYVLLTVSIETAFLVHWTSTFSDIAVGKPESFVAAVERQMSKTRNEALIQLKQKAFFIEKDTVICGFRFMDDFRIVFNHFGVIEKGSSVGVVKDNDYYRLSIPPVTAEIRFSKIP